MRIRFYHYWVYRLWAYFWEPILRSRPDMAENLKWHLSTWIENNEIERKKIIKLRVVK